ncbi:oxidoreductase, luciferase-like monooxygenase [Xenorhabdus mauleonii]|uniref:Oxidoreductase, luciferase-like monooxygenase n=1 Tax=Xenorhabdus mauleonii TaxID=351675 RepID=A0A1I3Q4S6_9GAMM|nr:LLM class flavin-dependent oxidoreductase [Xenorhabdus mauleonii]PHM40092.1 oxidoreductase, luciferase-like monooxygenase [Xenorhabdus mauleonii]SFJ28622.1 pyrimidine oxygenase [Xenorhabdus mauleonii]
MSKKEFGVFLPIANGGWIVSKNTPPLDASYKQNREAAILADQIGLDYIMAIGKWKGFGGETDHWGTSLEAVTMLSGIAEVTHRAKLIATVHAGLHNPAVTAKMITTLDHISQGRAGLNIVSGSFRDEFEQMGAWDNSLDHAQRYAMTAEWTQLIKRLWREKRVDHEGAYFHLKQCVSEPKPLSNPRPYLFCAGQSERGLRFSVQNADVCFISGRDEADTRKISLTAKRIAAEYNKPTKTFSLCTIIFAETDAHAETLAQFYRQGVDAEGVQNMMNSYGIDTSGKNIAMVERSKHAFMTQTIIGTPENCYKQLSNLMRNCELDGVMLIFTDYIKGLKMFGDHILPRFREEYSENIR